MSTTFFTASDAQNLRFRCKSLWEAGDFGVVARYNEPAAAEFVARLPLEPGARFLDLACGTGNLAVLAARAGCAARGLDIAANLIAQARARARTEGLAIEFTEGDAEDMPYADASFDVVASMFGVMFAPRPEHAVAELVRVCRPGGAIALANWTAEGIFGETLDIIGRHVAPPSGCVPPILWGDEETVCQRLGGAVGELRLTRRMARLRYPYPPSQTVAFFRQFYAPTLRAFAALTAAGQAQLHRDLEELFRRQNRGGSDATELHAEYLEVMARKSA